MICGRLEVVVGFANVVSADDDDDGVVAMVFLAAFSEEVAEEDESDEGDSLVVILKSETSFWASVALVRLRNEKSDMLWNE